MNKSIVTDKRGEEFFSCAVNKKEKCLYANWEGIVVDSESAKKACLHLASIAMGQGILSILNDNRKQLGNWPDIEPWLAEIWIPTLKESGLKYFAHIVSPDINTNHIPHKLFNRIYLDIEFVTFRSYASATDWLKNRD